uniref:Si:ch73-190m4.1 n=1 Tax=Astyanax mexicanus TaxID=7994 RepID=A0A8B9JSP5_ASTMX
MLCYWGEEEGVRAGFGLVKPGRVQRTQSGVSFFSPGGRITQLAAGQRLVGFIRGDGSVSVLRLTPLEAPSEKTIPESLELKEKIRLMSCGETQAVLLADGGKVLLMDQLNFCRLILSGTKVIQVACGNQHCMALTHDGQLFTWGENSSGQLGLGSGKSNSPQPLRSLRGIPLAQISAGGDHSFALSLSGTVFGWGRNNAGQLGLGNAENRSTPACVNHLNLKKTVFISCGEDHTATLSKGGTVFTFGSGRFGQLGHNSFRDELRPRVVAALWGSKVSQITCGRNHTLALVSSSNTVYSFGWQLGNWQQTNQCVPLPVDLLPESNHGQEIEQIAAGGNHSFALCSQQENDSVQPESTQNEGILVLEDRLIDRWISECAPDDFFCILISHQPSLPEERYFLFGCLCGLAFYNNSVVNLPFPLALFKKLVNVQPSLEDLTEFSPVLGQSLQSTLDYSDEDLQSAEMPYTVSVLKKFVEAYVDHAMNGSVERVFEEFRRGFYKVCDRDVVKLFLPEELRGVMLGSEEYDWDILKQNVTYEGLFHPRHPTIISFWEVFDELSARDKKAFLLFLTGFDRVPVLGMNQVKMRVRPLLFYTQDHLPEALTCHSLLELPVYNTKETLKDKLTEALQHKRGFWDD